MAQDDDAMAPPAPVIDDHAPLAEIGFDVAMARGVDVGVAAMSVEMAALVRAAGAPELARLRALGEIGAASAVPGAVAEMAALAEVGQQEMSVPIVASPVPRVSTPPMAQAETDSGEAASVMRPVMRPVVRGGHAVAAFPMSPRAPAVSPTTTDGAAATVDARTTETPGRMAFSVFSPMPLRTVGSRSCGSSPEGWQAPSRGSSLRAVPQRAGRTAAMAWPARSGTGLAMPSGSGDGVSSADDAAPDATPARPEAAMTPPPVARRAVSSGRNDATADANDEVGAPTSAPEKKDGSSDATPAMGDVFLDGMRVGRWMAKTLAHEASQPQGGSTFHDPRMGPVFPGSLQGS